MNRFHPLVTVKMSVKFNGEAQNGLVFIVFTRSKRDGHTDERTDRTISALIYPLYLHVVIRN